MSAAQPQPASEPEVVDAVPVGKPSPVPRRWPRRPRRRRRVVRQAAAVAATTFVAGAATIAVARARPPRRGCAGGAGARGLGQVVATRSFLVDVHVLAPRD